jgi:hemolysin III
MTSLTGSTRLAIDSSALARGTTAVAITVVSPAESIADLAKAAVESVRAIDSSAWTAPRATAARLVQTLNHLEEESLNAITHALGLAISAAGFVYLLNSALAAGGWLRVTCCAVYGASLMTMYLASTLLHAARRPDLQRRFQLFDHVAIYLLIAGTYTPFLGSLVQGRAGFCLLACVWILAAIGIAIKVKYAARLEDTSPLPCVGLGWLGLVAIKSLVAALPAGGMALLVAGGVTFSAGVVFYCRDEKRYFHAIWHLFVMAGTGLHYGAIVLYIAQ